MLGEQGDIDEKIEIVNKTIIDIEKDYKDQENVVNKYAGDKQITAPDYHMTQMINLLKGDTNWAGRERLIIKDAKKNSNVTQGTIHDIALLAPKHTNDVAQKEYDKEFIELKKFTNGAEKVVQKFEPENLPTDEEALLALLAEKIEKPVLLPRDQLIMKLVLEGQQIHFEKVRDTFSDSSRETCPFCLQPINNDYKSQLVESIGKVLSKAVEEHKEKLNTLKLAEITISFNHEIDSLQIKKCEDALKTVNEIIKKYNTNIDKKIENVYIPLELESLGLTVSIQELNKEIAVLEKLRIEHNLKFEQIENIRKSLIQLNKELAHYAIQEHYVQYVKLNNELREEKEKLQNINKILIMKKRDLNTLLQQKKSIDKAGEYINKGLEYIFLSKNRLVVEVKDDVYTLLSNGKPLKPSSVSCGERNIIALCYFFTEIMNNKDLEKFHKDEVFLVIDDPVSSYDLENRIGILSYLKFQMLRILSGNFNSKIIIMSHDLGCIYDINKLFMDVYTTAEGKYKEKITIKELNNFTLVDFETKERNEYSQLLQIIYEYANGNSNENDLIIGNVMRRVLEAFSTFEFRQGIEKVSCDQHILSLICSPELRDYFENRMNRLVLNGESHSRERIACLQDMNFFSNVSDTEKKRTARDVLCLINALNPNHIEAHFGGCDEAKKMIKSWSMEIITG